ncbi:gag protease polyprotein [Cucumis melo var. makuwa]|uniref:Gag protease polyprotein n=1 Tax=Cucumis melo var. makuwa TaxID=1194695 RepID=A0A5D3DW57_CUCMM|nr:gag protease polyprotein [Cucumis melo var. makuwa]
MTLMQSLICYLALHLRPATDSDALCLAVDMSLHKRVDPSKAAEKGWFFQRHCQEIAIAGKTLKELPACRSLGETVWDYLEPNFHFSAKKSICHYSLGGRRSWYCGDSIDFSRKEVVFNPHSGASFKYKEARNVVLPKVILATRASKLLNQEYIDVFPDDFLILPTHKVINFAIELKPDTVLISRAPYKMASAKLKKLVTTLVLIVPDGSGSFVIYSDASKKGQDYDCEILYHPSNADVVADALSMKVSYSATLITEQVSLHRDFEIIEIAVSVEEVTLQLAQLLV